MTWFLLSDSFLDENAELGDHELHPRFEEMRCYLDRVAPAGALPGRQHIDPIDFRDVIALVNLADVEWEGAAPKFRFRLVGTMQTEMAGREITGLRVEDAVLPEFAGRIVGNMNKVLSARLPVYDRFSMPHPDRQFVDSERMYFPLAGDGETIDMLLILNGYF